MFSLNKSLAKLKEALEEEGLVKKKTKKTKPVKEAGGDNGEASYANKQKKPKKMLANLKEDEGDQPGVVMIRNFPHGFYEKQMFDYFSQFGQVTRLKIVRSRKTGKPRNYGFIEFKYQDVAKIAADTMNNYLMFNQIVKCTVLSKESVRKDLFKNWNRPFVSTVKKHKATHNKTKTAKADFELLKKRLRRVHSMKSLLSPKGIEFEPVIVNRPTDLKERVQQEEDNPEQQLAQQPQPSLYSRPPLVIPARKRPTKKRRQLVVWKYVKLQAAARKRNLVQFN